MADTAGKITLEMSDGIKTITENLGYITYDAMGTADSIATANEKIYDLGEAITALTTNTMRTVKVTYEVDLAL